MVVNRSTMYLVPVVVPEIELLFPVKPVRPVDEMLNDSATDDAALKFVSPACAADSEHVPEVTIVKLRPETVQTLVVLDVTVTVSPDVDDADNVSGVLDHVVVPGFVNVIVWFALATVIVVADDDAWL